MDSETTIELLKHKIERYHVEVEGVMDRLAIAEKRIEEKDAEIARLRDAIREALETRDWAPLIGVTMIRLPVTDEDRKWAHDAFKGGIPCPTCGGTRVIDSGGQNPDGSWITLVCPTCRGGA